MNQSNQKQRIFALLLACSLKAVSFTSIGQTTPHTCGAVDIHNGAITYGQVSDIDGNVYKTVTIDEKIWFAENLKVTRFQDGTAIPEVPDTLEWSELTSPGLCYYQNNPAFECPYGRLYNFYVAADPRNPCPNGWRVPSMEDLYDLIFFLDPNANPQQPGNTPNSAGGPLKSIGLTYWREPNTNATNLSGFSAIPNGGRNDEGLFSFSSDAAASYWLSTPSGPNNSMGFFLELAYPQDYAVRNAYWSNYGCCIRCVTDVGAMNLNHIKQNGPNVYPNPANDRIYISSNQPMSGAEYIITDLTGKLQRGGILSQDMSIPIADLPYGVYFLSFPEKGVAVSKIIKR